MSKHSSFPAAHLSAYEVGKRIQVITVDGVKIADTLTTVMVKQDEGKKSTGKVRIFLQFKNLKSHYAVEVNPDQFIKRMDDEA